MNSRLLALLFLLMPRVARAITIPNPLGSENLEDILTKATGAILKLAIPVAAAMYIWAGLLALTAGAKPDNYKKAKEVFKYTTIGLVVVLIGGGFVELIKSILNLGN